MLLLSPMLKMTLAIGPFARDIPEAGTILWECAGEFVDYCCRRNLWSKWYPVNHTLPQLHPWNVHARRPHVEADIGEPVSQPLGPFQFARIGCIDMDRELLPGHIRRTGQQWLYPCPYDHQLVYSHWRARWNRRYWLYKVVCRRVMHETMKYILRRTERNCMRIISNGLHKVLRIASLATARSRIREQSTVVPVPFLSLVNLNTTKLHAILFKGWSHELLFDDLMEGHTYLACASGRDDADVVIELSFGVEHQKSMEVPDLAR